MSSPVLLSVYPANNDVGIPIGSQLVLSFDRSVDVSTVKDFIVLYGSSFDQTSGPDSALWIDEDTGANPFFLQSPGFKGPVDIQVLTTYYDLSTGENLPNFGSTAETTDTAYGLSGAGHRVYVTPVSGQLAPDTLYTLQILGDPQTLDTGVSSRTVFDVVPSGGNTSTSGVVVCTGGYTGSALDSITIEITTSGDIGVAKYRWYYTSLGVGTAISDKLTNRRYRTLADGVLVKFSGEGFVSGDEFLTNVEPSERLAVNTKISFTTNDGTYSVAPASPSTPASSTPPASVIPPAPGIGTVSTRLQIVETNPTNGAYNLALNARVFSILFSELLDPTTITAETVRVFKYPILGVFEGQPPVVELQKKLTVNGQLLTIEI